MKIGPKTTPLREFYFIPFPDPHAGRCSSEGRRVYLPLEWTCDNLTEENMAACNRDETVRRVPTLVSSLSMDVLERLGMKLNPRHLMKDFRYLAGKMNYNYEMVRNIERQRNPTIFLLNDWFMTHARNGEPKTVTDLIELLKDMQRDDAVDLLKPVEFTGKCN